MPSWGPADQVSWLAAGRAQSNRRLPTPGQHSWWLASAHPAFRRAGSEWSV